MSKGSGGTRANSPSNGGSNVKGLTRHEYEDPNGFFENETTYEGSYKGKRVKIEQSVVGSNDWWNIKYDGNYILNADNMAMSFQTPNEAFNELKDIVSKKSKKK